MADKICQYYDDGRCMGQKWAPPTDCIGNEAMCECDSYVSKIEKTSSMVNHPAHYNTGGVECIDGLAAATAGLEGIEAFCTANAIKYLWRWKWKNGVEDLDKAIWYINYLKKQLDKNN